MPPKSNASAGKLEELRRLLNVNSTGTDLMAEAIAEIKALRPYREKALKEEVVNMSAEICRKALQVLDKDCRGLMTHDMPRLMNLGLVQYQPPGEEHFEATARLKELAPYMRNLLGMKPQWYTVVWVDLSHNSYVRHQEAYSPYEAVDLAMAPEDNHEPSEPYTVAGVFAGKLERLYSC